MKTLYFEMKVYERIGIKRYAIRVRQLHQLWKRSAFQLDEVSWKLKFRLQQALHVLQRALANERNRLDLPMPPDPHHAPKPTEETAV